VSSPVRFSSARAHRCLVAPCTLRTITIIMSAGTAPSRTMVATQPAAQLRLARQRAQASCVSSAYELETVPSAVTTPAATMGPRVPGSTLRLQKQVAQWRRTPGSSSEESASRKPSAPSATSAARPPASKDTEAKKLHAASLASRLAPFSSAASATTRSVVSSRKAPTFRRSWARTARATRHWSFTGGGGGPRPPVPPSRPTSAPMAPA